MSKKVKPRRIQPLFFRIFRSISLPMFILLVVFSYLVIQREVKIQRAHFMTEGKNAMTIFEKEFELILNDPKVMDNPEELTLQIKMMEKDTQAERIDLINPIAASSLLVEPNHGKEIRRKKSWVFTSSHMENIQKSFAAKRQGHNYHLLVDTRANKLFGYYPFKNPIDKKMNVAVCQYRLTSLKEAIRETGTVLFGMSIFVLLTTFIISFRLSFRIVRPLQSINKACREILEGNLGKQVKVRTGDEIELLANNFNRMSQALLVMTHRAEDSNPLTQLPGNRQIRNEVGSRIVEDRKFIFFHCDIDHFKAFNDQYGLARGDDAIRMTAKILREAANEYPEDQNFVGHQGGDDFILIVEPSHAEIIAKKVCDNFDKSIKDFYTKEDLERGYFVAADTRSTSLSGDVEMKRHSLMSFTLAGISNVKRPFKSYQEVLERAVPVKKQAKKIPYSVFLIEESYQSDETKKEETKEKV